ncbi:MAG: hypothetical protein E7531_04915 [Ruminococcaceae bacterium]|nr:hypothetical protein [Oscillospiraceae bacterium]
MNENTMNTDFEKENIETAIYNSKFLMDKELFYDFGSVNYNRIKKLFLFFFCSVTLLIGLSLLDHNYDLVICFAPFISFLVSLIYFRTKKMTKISYERAFISAGKDSILNYELFEDKIVSHIEELKREYFYHQITRFFETKNFLLLHLQHNLYITIEKSSLNANTDEVKSFLLEKCPLVKKRKFISCINDKKWSLVFLIALIVVSLTATILGLMFKTNFIF